MSAASLMLKVPVAFTQLQAPEAQDRVLQAGAPCTVHRGGAAETSAQPCSVRAL